ncbi:MAG: HDOD domain-containing protein [Planctomycetes bacterium]|nr:HDOD domain-containing protein [Planctomycetota bacterium]
MTAPADLWRSLEATESLPSLPAVYERVARLANDPGSNAATIAEVVCADLALSGRLLKLVNSSIYGFPREISTITRAIVVLGFDALRQLVLAACAVDLFPPAPAARLDLGAFWEHSLSTGLLAKSIAVYRRDEEAEEAFVGGLLHDVGKLVLARHEPGRYGEVVERHASRGTTLAQEEREAFGADHAQVGGFLLERWRLPPRLVALVSCHHRPWEAAGAAERATAVQLADALSIALGWGNGGDRWVAPVEGGALERLRLAGTDLDPILAAVEREYEETKSIFRPGRMAS